MFRSSVVRRRSSVVRHMNAIEIENLHKSYDNLSVLRGLDLRVPGGKVYGLLGPNGAGKSTLIHLMLGFLRPNRGKIAIFGQNDLELARQRVGYLPERLRYHLRFSGREYLRYLGHFSDLPEPELSRRVEQELRTVGLLDAADRQLATYSKGMLQRLGIAQALLADPDMLLIDEPTSGLDPAGQREMIALLAELRSRDHTIFLATHQLDEIEQLCDTVGILYGGKLAAEIDVPALRQPGHTATLVVGDLPAELATRIERIAPAVHCSGREITLQPNTPALQAQVLRALLDAEISIISLAPQGRPLEEIYMRIVQGGMVAVPMPIDPAADAPPAGMFAPPGHPDAVGGAHIATPPPSDGTPPGRPGTGDTLLRELLSREQQTKTDRHEQET